VIRITIAHIGNLFNYWLTHNQPVGKEAVITHVETTRGS
jgi:hypothetical protein